MTSPIKGLVVFGVVGTVAGGVYLGRSLLANKEDKSIRNHLLSKGFKLISDLSEKDGVNDQWTEEFKSDKEEIKKLLETTESEDEAGGILLKNWCEKRFKEDYSDTYENLDKVQKYCLLRTVQSQLLRNKKKLLGNFDVDKGEWEATYNKRKETTAKSPRSQIKGLEGQWNTGTDTKDRDLPVIKAWCSRESGELFLAKRKDSYIVVENWCTKEGASVGA